MIKETFVVILRFMANFCYVAFAFNRISLIGKDHNKLVEFVSKVSFRKYLIFTGLISVTLSIVKAFKYRINYDHSELNYPFLIEGDLFEDRGWTRDLYFGANLVSDACNYLLFVLINISLDILMLIRLRKTLKDKLERLGVNPNTVKCEKKTNKAKNKIIAEINHAIVNAVRMVIMNSTMNFLFKLPLVFIPLLNVIAAIYFKSDNYKQNLDLRFDNFIKYLTASDLITLMNETADVLFNLYISIQVFIYFKYDFKLKEAFFARFFASKKITDDIS